MNKPISSTSCQSGCWILAAVSGVVVLAVCLFPIELGILASILMIKGVGPKLETMLNELGYYHFDQIAGWSAAEVAWVNDNLTGFKKGRVSLDNWVEQARKLASGQETEFSKRVSD